MFDLEREIQRWRRELVADGLSGLELDELEDHLRSDIEGQRRSGVAIGEAFAIAVERIGRGGQLNTQFEVANASALAKGPSGNAAAVAKTAIGYLAVCALVVAAVYFVSGVPLASKTAASLLGVGFLAIAGVEIWVHSVGRAMGTDQVFPGSFTKDNQELLSVARDEARRLGHDYVGTEHLLLALTSHNTSVFAKLLENVGLSREQLRKEIENRIKACPAHNLRTSLLCTPRLNKALRLAANEAASGCKQINADYVLLGLLRERTGVAGDVLRSLGFNAEQVRSSLA